MGQKPPTRVMRENADIDQLKREAEELLEAYRASSTEAVAEVTAYHRTATPETFALDDAQFVLARSYGFESWPKLEAAVDGVTAVRLHEAVERGDLKAARELLTRRPEIVDLGRGEMRAVHMAVLKRDLEMTRLLVEFGADPDGGIWPKRDATGPYTLARERGYDEIAGVLRAARERRGARGPNGPTEAVRKCQQAFESGSEDAIVAVFDQHPELAEMCPADGRTMLHQAAGLGAMRWMKWLLDRGADVNRNSHQGWTPLDYAATGRGGDWVFDNQKFERTAALLLEHGAQLSPISAAALGRWEYLEKCSKQELEGKGVLEAAVKGNRPEVLRRLLDLGLDPDERTQVGPIAEQNWSAGGPLFQAVVLNRIGMARLLLERGADPNANVWTSGSPILAVSSYPTRTSPPVRGKWVLENLLGAAPLPPPPDVPVLNEANLGKTVSLRQRMEQHRKDPSCAVCHNLMDPIGFGLESYDAVGAWRDNDGDVPIDTSGVLPDGKPFRGAKDLKQILRGQSAAFTRNLTEKLLTFALGRGLEPYDRRTVEDIVRKMEQNNYRFSTLVMGIIKSKPFGMRSGEIGGKG